MFFKSDRGRYGPYILPRRDSDEPIRLNEARLAAWAIDQDGGSGRKPFRRPHRGMLPDVDFSRVVPARRRPGLIARLFRLLAGRLQSDGPGESTDEPGTHDEALGEAERKSYVWVLEWESDAVKPHAPIRVKDRSRAA